MFEMPVKFNSILPCQEAFLVDAPTPNTSPHRWIQAKPSSAEAFPFSVSESHLRDTCAASASSA